MPERRVASLDFSQRPILVFWEITKACLLACRHCRASAVADPQPGELSTSEGRRLIRQIADFGRPRPILILTGGDCLMRPDVFDLARYASDLAIPVCMSPSVTPLLTPSAVEEIRRAGIKVVSISLDGATPATHDSVRGISGHFAATLDAIAMLVAADLRVQVNTTVMSENVDELARVAAIVARLGCYAWEVFFLVPVGRGSSAHPVSPAQHEQVCNFLFDASRYGFQVRTVEAPFFRRVVAWRRGESAPDRREIAVARGGLYRRLQQDLIRQLGTSTRPAAVQTVSTRDGNGLVFIGHDGWVQPAGFLPVPVGNVRERSLSEIYRSDDLMRSIRAADLNGRCGACSFRERCGGSRARAFAWNGDPLGEDPACIHEPWQAEATGA